MRVQGYKNLSDDKHRKVRDSSKKCTGNPRQIQSETKFSPRILCQWSEKNFFQTEFCLGLYLSWTEFCLRLNLSDIEFCLGLHTAVVFRMQSFNYKLYCRKSYYVQSIRGCQVQLECLILLFSLSNHIKTILIIQMRNEISFTDFLY